MERVLGWKYEAFTTDGRIDRVTHTCYDVPLLSSLQCLLQNTSVIKQVSFADHLPESFKLCNSPSQIFNPHSLRGGLYGDYCDGKQFKAHPLFSIDPHALQIILYYDDVEMCNPIGSYTKVHKLGEYN